MSTKYTKGEVEFNQYAKKHDKRLLGLYGELIRLSNGEIIEIVALSKRKCKYLVLGGYNHTPSYKFSVNMMTNSLVDEDVKAHFLEKSNFVQYNANPSGHNVDDCSVRAISKAFGISWKDALMKLTLQACELDCMPNNDDAIEATLEAEGYVKKSVYDSLTNIVEEYPNCLAFQASHMVAVVDGKYYDKSDTGSNVVSAVFVKA